MPLEHELAEPEMAGEVAVAVQQPIAETHRHDDGPDDEDDVEERGADAAAHPQNSERADPAPVVAIFGEGHRQDPLLVSDSHHQKGHPRGDDGGERESQVAQQDSQVDQDVDRIDRVPREAVGSGGDQDPRLRLEAEGTAEMPERPQAQRRRRQPDDRAHLA